MNDGYRDAVARNGAGMSMQTYNIVPRMREVDAAITTALQTRVMEAHPELAFAALAGHPMRHNKKTPNGRRERMVCLRRAFGGALRDPLRVRLELGLAAVALDDVLDAYVLAWTANRIRNGHGQRLPAGDPPIDARGLRMEVWF